MIVRNDPKQAISLAMNRTVCLPAGKSVPQRKEFPVRLRKSSATDMSITAASVMLERRQMMY